MGSVAPWWVLSPCLTAVVSPLTSAELHVGRRHAVSAMSGMECTQSQMKFYEDGEHLNFSKATILLFIEIATTENSGQYSFSGQVMYSIQTLTPTLVNQVHGKLLAGDTGVTEE